MSPQEAARGALDLLDPVLLSHDAERRALQSSDVPKRLVRRLYPYAPENYAAAIEALRIRTQEGKKLRATFDAHRYEWLWASMPLSIVERRQVKASDRFPRVRLAELMRVLNLLAEHDHGAYIDGLADESRLSIEASRWRFLQDNARWLSSLAAALAPVLQGALEPVQPEVVSEVPLWFRKRTKRRITKRRSGHPRAYSPRHSTR